MSIAAFFKLITFFFTSLFGLRLGFVDTLSVAFNEILPPCIESCKTLLSNYIGNPDHSAPADGSDAEITLCLMGDLMCLAGQQFTAETGGGAHDYTGCFSLVTDTFSACDFVVGNLETILSESNPYATVERNVNGQPNCNAPADYLASLRAAGLTNFVTANNHCLDGDTIGVRETIAHLDEYNFPHTGTFLPEAGTAPYMLLEKNGLRIAVLAYTELINQRNLLAPEVLSAYINDYSAEKVAAQIAAARNAGADFVIVYNHWGSENTHEVRSAQKEHALEIARAGADLIIGSHPHCLQPMEYLEADGRIVPCFYSLGNVVSSMTRDINHDTVFVLLTLERTNETDSAESETLTDSSQARPQSRLFITSQSLLPCHVLKSEGDHSLVITPVDYDTQSEKNAAELAAAKERIEAIFPNDL